MRHLLLTKLSSLDLSKGLWSYERQESGLKRGGCDTDKSSC